MSIKIIKELGNDRYEVEIPPVDRPKGLREIEFGLVHDYVYFGGYVHLSNDNGSVSKVSCWEDIKIPIRDFVNMCLPEINKHKYSKEEHLKDREHTEDDTYSNPPRYKKGDKYPAYAYDDVAIFFWGEEKERMVAVRLSGEKNYTIMTNKMYNLVKDSLSKQILDK